MHFYYRSAPDRPFSVVPQGQALNLAIAEGFDVRQFREAIEGVHARKYIRVYQKNQAGAMLIIDDHEASLSSVTALASIPQNRKDLISYRVRYPEGPPAA